MFNIFQRSREGVDELVWQLRQEADGVHVQNCHAAGQLAGVDGDVQRGKQLVSGLKTTVTCQCFDQGGFSWTNDGKTKEVIKLINTEISLYYWIMCDNYIYSNIIILHYTGAITVSAELCYGIYSFYIIFYNLFFRLLMFIC